MFIRGPPDYLKGSQIFCKPHPYPEIVERFKQAFPGVVSFQLSNDIQSELANSLSTLQETLNKVVQFKKRCKSNVLSFYRYEEGLVNLSTGISEVKRYFFPTKDTGVELAKKATNPYKILLDWARKEALEVESLIEVIEKRMYLDEVLSKIQARLGKQQQGLENFQHGKKSFFQKLSKKPTDQKTKELEDEIRESESDAQALQEVIRLATGRLVGYQIPLFKEKEVEKLESTIRCYSGLIIEEYNDFITHFTNIQESISPSVI